MARGGVLSLRVCINLRADEILEREKVLQEERMGDKGKMYIQHRDVHLASTSYDYSQGKSGLIWFYLKKREG
jgi:hypothetical protein